MTLPRQRITLVTLGVADLDRARRFYAAWGWAEHPSDAAGVAFYQMHGAGLALFPLDDLAADQGRPAAPLGTGAVTLAQNCTDEADTDAVWHAAVDAGATPLKRPEKCSGAAIPAMSRTPTAMCGKSPQTRSGRWPRTAR